MGLFKSIGKAFKGLAGFATGIVGGVLGGLLDKPEVPEIPPPPVVTPPTPMPLPDDEAIQQARRRSIAAQMQRSGRASTLLTQDPVTGGTLG